MIFRHAAVIVLVLTIYLPAATAQQNCAPGDAGCGAQTASPYQNPMVLFPWLANTTPGLAAGIQGQGTSGQWMNMQWMVMMANHFMNAPIDEATRFSILDAMLRAANTQMLAGVMGGDNQARMWIPSQNRRELPPNTVSDSLSVEAKRNLYQNLMMLSPLSLRDMIAIMADKMPVADGVSFDDAVVARKILDYAPEFVVFIPCRIALLEDAEGKLWVMTLDWDVNWLNLAQNPNSVLDDDLREEAMRIRKGIRYIMEGAASGDF